MPLFKVHSTHYSEVLFPHAASRVSLSHLFFFQQLLNDFIAFRRHGLDLDRPLLTIIRHMKNVQQLAAASLKSSSCHSPKKVNIANAFAVISLFLVLWFLFFLILSSVRQYSGRFF